MDTNAPGTSSNPHVNDIDNENIDNSDINIDNENTNIFIRIERNLLDNVPGMISMRQIRRYANRIYDEFFLNKELGFQCQLMLQLMRMSKMRKVMKTLGVYVKKEEPLKQVISTVASAMDSIGKKSRSKDKNAARRAITTALVNRSTAKKRMIGNLSGYLNIHRKTLQRAMKRRKSIEIDPINQCWSFSGRLPRSDRKLTNEIKIIIEKFWHDHTRVSPNIKDVLKEKKSLGSKDYKPEHAKHFLDMTQTQLYNKFVNDKVLSAFNISVSQRSFEKCKPWYVRINKQRVTCCCKTHMQFRYYYQVF